METFEYDYDSPMIRYGRDEFWAEKTAMDKQRVDQEEKDLSNK